jgi:uncharacterized membrane protein
MNQKYKTFIFMLGTIAALKAVIGISAASWTPWWYYPTMVPLFFIMGCSVGLVLVYLILGACRLLRL